MRIRSFIVAYALVLAILLFADRRPDPTQQDRYSHVLDLTVGPTATRAPSPESSTRIIAPGDLIPGTWAAGQIPSERLVAPLVVLDAKPDLNPDLSSDLNGAQPGSRQISLDDIAAWETRHGVIPPGSVVAIRCAGAPDHAPDPAAALPIARDAAQFLIDARNTIGFAVETPVNLASDRALARQIALRGNYVVESAARFTSLPATGSLVIVAPEKGKKRGEAPVRVLAMVR